MKPSISLKKTWSDDDVLKLAIEVNDDRSSFESEAYVSVSWTKELISALRAFREQVYGGLYDLEAGAFGPEFAGGAFLARLNFKSPGILYVSTFQQGEYLEYKGRTEAAEAKFYLKSEPVLLDRFIDELAAMETGARADATLECA